MATEPQHDSNTLIATSDALDSFADNVNLLWCSSTIPILDQPPSSLVFSRDFVALSRPCIIRNAIMTPTQDSNENKPMHLTLDDIVDHIDPDATVLTVDITPDGHGDCVRTVHAQQQQQQQQQGNDVPQRRQRRRRMFVKPHEEQMTLSEFASRLRRSGRAKEESESSPLLSADDAMLDENLRRIFPLANSEEDEESTCTASITKPQTQSQSQTQSLQEETSVLYYSRQVRACVFPIFICSCLCIHNTSL
jgi:hypothetical protein